MTDLASSLKRLFGYDSFRPHQEDVVSAVLGGRDAFVVMPTGSGKSICYQLPASLLEGAAVVVSPLISLMKDQVDAAAENGLKAATVNSSQLAGERRRALEAYSSGGLDLLYVSPERLATDSFLARLKGTPPSFFAVDEAHCISEWGHEFRPDYLFLSRLKELFPAVPVAAFTATATGEVERDTVRRLNLSRPFQVRASFDRPNLAYRVTPKARDVAGQILEFLGSHRGEAGIVYRTTRDDVETTARRLVEGGLRALPYHAGLSDEERRGNQEAFNRDEADVVVATIAFGMGIDKSNVRFVVHGDLPKTVENYYQETGRAGRDGLPAECVLFFSRADSAKLRWFVNQIADGQQRRVASEKLNSMVNLAAVGRCRRRQVLAYFGEGYDRDDCGACDVCASPAVRQDATADARLLLEAVAATGQRFGAAQVVDVICGAATAKVRQYGHDTLEVYGAGKAKGKAFWRQILEEMAAAGLLSRSEGQYPTLGIEEAGREVLAGGRAFEVLPAAVPAKKETARPPRLAGGDCDEALFERLRALRKRIADGQGVPPFVVFHDRTLVDMATRKPSTEEEMRAVYGMGERKFASYGKTFLEAIGGFEEAP